jgi:hypothetical protein
MYKKKHVCRIDDNDHSDVWSYEYFKAKKEFESVLKDEIKKVEEASEAKRS